jgi:hypothetical protein
MLRLRYNKSTFCGRRIMVITRASQACDAGSIPVARSNEICKQGQLSLLVLLSAGLEGIEPIRVEFR